MLSNFSSRAIALCLLPLFAVQPVWAQDDAAIEEDDMPDGSEDFEGDPLTEPPPAAAGQASETVEVGTDADDGADLREVLTTSAVPRAERYYRDISYGLPRVNLTAVATDPGDPDVILVGADGFVFKTDDGGESWRPVLSFPRGLPDNTPLAAGQTSDLNDATVDPTDLPDVEENEAEFVDVDDPDDAEDALEEAEDVDLPDFDLADGDDLPDGDVDAALASTISPRLLEGVRRIRFISAKYRTVYVATPRGLFRSIDIGETFSQIQLPGSLAANDVRDVAIDPQTPTRVYLATRQGLLVSDDGGVSFRDGNLPNRLGTLSVTTASLENDDLVLVGTVRGVFRSWDKGATFRQMLLSGVPVLTPVSDVAYDARQGLTYAATQVGLFAGVRRAAIMERRRELGSVPVFAISVDPRRDGGLALTHRDRGVVFSDDTGLSSVPMPDPFPAPNAFSLARPADDTDRLLIATERGLFVHDKGSGLSATQDQLRRLMDAYKKEPTLPETAQMALHYYRLHPDSFNAMARRTRFLGYAPQVQFIYRYTNGRSTRLNEDLILTEEAPVDFDASDINDINALYELGIISRAPQRGNFHSAFVLFRWDFDQIWFNSRERQTLGFRSRLRRAQNRVINRVQILHGVRRRMVTDAILTGDPTDAASLAGRSIRLQEVNAQLDGLTGGGFSQAMTKMGGEPWMLTLEPPPPSRLKVARPDVGQDRVASGGSILNTGSR